MRMDSFTDRHHPTGTLSGEFTFRPIAHASELKQASDLLNLAFQVPRGMRFFDDFPVWEQSPDADPSAQKRLGAFDRQGRLAATAGGRIAQLRVPSGTMPVGIIGMVATHPQYRGRGLASRLVSTVSQQLAQQNVPLIVLWGSEHQFYRRLGFAVCGRQALIPLRSLKLPEPPQDPEVGTGWRPELFEALQKKTSGLALSPKDRGWIEAHKNVHWFWIRSKTGNLAYAALGRGIDLTGMVHEWGGEPDSLKRLLAHLNRKYPDTQLLGSPASLTQLAPQARDSSTLQSLCLARVLDPAKILSAFQVPSDRIFTKGRTPEQEALLAESLFGGDLDLPLWFWGLDSA